MKSKKILKKFLVVLLTMIMIIPSNLQMVLATKKQNKNLIKLQAKTITLNKSSKKYVNIITSSKCKIKKSQIIKNTNKKAVAARISKGKIFLIGNKQGKAVITIRVKYKYKKKNKIEKLQLQVNVKEKKKENCTIKLSTEKLSVNEKEKKQVKIITSSNCKIKNVVIKNNNKKLTDIKVSKSKIDITGLKEGKLNITILIKYEYNKKIKSKEIKLQIQVIKKSKKIIHTVYFESNGGTPLTAVKIADGEVLQKPLIDPQKEGYTFKDWYIDKDLTQVYDFSQKIYKNMTLYANWEKNKEAKTYTRSEWIKVLIDSLNTEVVDTKNDENVDYEYADIQDDENVNEIQTAYYNGLIN